MANATGIRCGLHRCQRRTAGRKLFRATSSNGTMVPIWKTTSHNMLRIARSNDEIAIATLWRLAWASANPQALHLEPIEHWQTRVRAEFTPPSHTLVYETEESGILAFLVLNIHDAYLHQLFVQPCAHRSGIGSELVRHVCLLCPDGWSLHVATSNERARRFYEHLGLVKGVASLNPSTSRERLIYSWQPQNRTSKGP